MQDNLWEGVFNLLTPEYQAERKKKEEEQANFDFHQRLPLLWLLDRAEDVLRESTIRQKGKRTTQYIDLLESFLLLYVWSNRTNIGFEVVLFFRTLVNNGNTLLLFRDKTERLEAYQEVKKAMLIDVESLKARIKKALPDNVEKEIT